MELSHQVSFFVAFFGGLASFLSPCVLPLIPSYLSYITGMSFEALVEKGAKGEGRRKVAAHALCFILGFSLGFVSLGASFSLLSQFLFAYRGVLRIGGGLLLIFFGLYIIGLLKIPFLGQSKQLQLQAKPAGYLGSIVVGLAFAIAWTPCIGPILGSILALASTSANLKAGITLLLVYSLGLAVPFFLSALAVEAFLGFSKRFVRYFQLVKWLSGGLLVFVGLLILTGYFTILNAYAIRLTPQWLLKLL